MMLDGILTGQMQPLALLITGILLYLYFLPSLLAFLNGHRRFFIIFVFNLLVSPVQTTLLHFLAPGFMAVNMSDLAAIGRVALVANYGLGWIALMVWALRPGTPDPRLLAAQNTKLYDAIAALPLILWFAYGALQLRPSVVNDIALIAQSRADLFTWVHLFSLLSALAFDLLLVWLLVIRDRAIAKSKGLLPRICGFAGTFLGVGILQLPQVHLTLPMQFLAATLTGVGSLASALVLWRLGKAFSIMPEARTLVTSGPYAHARHPLYAVEMITIVGMALQFVQPWASLVALGVVILLVVRSVYEEQVLSAAYPDYAAYRAKTKRFIPGVI
jgi:protein-S-isoprenylcysteine O-methyltransferase Ste14